MSGPCVSVPRRWWRSPVGGVFNIVQLTLIGLKLAGVISWPWSIVLLRVWFGLGSLFIIGLGIAMAVGGERVALSRSPRSMNGWAGTGPCGSSGWMPCTPR